MSSTEKKDNMTILFEKITNIMETYNSNTNIVSTLDNIINICNDEKHKIKNNKISTKMKKKCIKLLEINLPSYIEEYFTEYNISHLEMFKNKCIQIINKLTSTDVEFNRIDYIIDNNIKFKFQNFEIIRTYNGDDEGEGNTIIVLSAQNYSTIFENEIPSINDIIKNYTCSTITKYIMYIMTDIVYEIFNGKVLYIDGNEWY